MAELTHRYVVMAMAAEAPFDPADPEGVFVLKPWKDPAALRALVTYRDNCYPELARELDRWIRTIEAGPPCRGDVGRRNEPHVKKTVAHAPPRGRRAPSRGGVREPTRRRAKTGTRRAPGKRTKRSR
jgi:hypothetical protein